MAESAVAKKLQRSGISATEVGQANMIAVTAVSPDPARAAEVASTKLPADPGPLARRRT